MTSNPTVWDERADTRLREYLKKNTLGVGYSDTRDVCSVAAINLALARPLDDKIPDCMSEMTGQWMIHVQDSMPDEMRNSAAWKNLLPAAAATGRDHEQSHLDTIIDWLYETVLPAARDAMGDCPDADGVGQIIEERDHNLTSLVRTRANRSAVKHLSMDISNVQLELTLHAEGKREKIVIAPASAARAAYWASKVTGHETPERKTLWDAFDPVGLLARLVEVPQTGPQPSP